MKLEIWQFADRELLAIPELQEVIANIENSEIEWNKLLMEQLKKKELAQREYDLKRAEQIKEEIINPDRHNMVIPIVVEIYKKQVEATFQELTSNLQKWDIVKYKNEQYRIEELNEDDFIIRSYSRGKWPYKADLETLLSWGIDLPWMNWTNLRHLLALRNFLKENDLDNFIKHLSKIQLEWLPHNKLNDIKLHGNQDNPAKERLDWWEISVYNWSHLVSLFEIKEMINEEINEIKNWKNDELSGHLNNSYKRELHYLIEKFILHWWDYKNIDFISERQLNESKKDYLIHLIQRESEEKDWKVHWDF